MLNRTLGLQRGITALAASCACALAIAGCSGQQFNLNPEQIEYGQKVTYTTKVDVLWVIDTSSSMSKHQNRLADQVGLFVDAMNATELDYQMAVTTMDIGSGGAKGRFLAKAGTPAILNGKTPNLAAVLSDRLRLGDDGSSMEQGLRAMKLALTAPLATTGPNAGFLRENSLLVVIFLSDEEDQSVDEDYAGFLDTLRPPLALGDRSWVAHFMGVMPDDPKCRTAEWGFSSPGLKYIELAERSEGVNETICDADLRRALTNVKARVLEVVTEWPLGREPAIETIKVTVNGAIVPQDSENGWTYYAANNSVRFHGEAVPKPGATIRVDFDPAGLK